MSSQDHEEKSGHPAQGSSSGKKKVVKNGSNTSTESPKRPLRPRRPAPHPTGVTSPVRQLQSPPQKPPLNLKRQQLKQQSCFAVDNPLSGSKQSSESERFSISSSADSDETEHKKETETPISAIGDRFQAASAFPFPHYDGKSLEKIGSCSSPIKPPKPAQRHSHDYCNGKEVSSPNVSLDGDRQGKEVYSKGSTALASSEATTPKHGQNLKDSPKKLVFSDQGATPKQDTGNKSGVIRRKTVGGLETEHGRRGIHGHYKKPTDGSKGDKPTPPEKPDFVKRHFSMRTPKELEDQLKSQPFFRYDEADTKPCDSPKIIETIKKLVPPYTPTTPTAIKRNSPTIHTKSDTPPKLPLLIIQTKPPESPHYKQTSEVATPRSALCFSHPGSPSQTSPLPAGEAPPKPPRTHAHDDYLKVHINVSQHFESKSSSDPPDQTPTLKPTVAVIKSTNIPEATPFEEEPCKTPRTPSVKARLSTKQQPPSPSTVAPPSPVSRSPKKEAPLVCSTPPARPPPPKRRPMSEDHSAGSYMLSHSHSAYHNTQDGWPVGSSAFTQSERRKQLENGHALSPRHPSDKLPPEPMLGENLHKFPRHWSLSSECLYTGQGQDSGLFADSGALSRSSYGSQFEVMMDSDLYAVPSTVMRLPGNQHSPMDGEKSVAFPNKFFARTQAFSGEHRHAKKQNVLGNDSTPIQEQTLTKVNKKTMNLVRQKINQVYAGVNIASGGLPQRPDSSLETTNRGPDAGDLQVEPAVLKKRIEYCASIRRRSSRSIRLSKEFLSTIYPQLFEYCLVVTLRPLVGEDGYEPYIMHKFPENVSGNLAAPSFCFPDATVYRPGSTTSLSESYSFVMTSADGTRVYGYCRRIQPPDASLPEVVCIVSPIDAFNMYNTLLNEIEDRRRISFDLASELIAASFGRPLPKPGKVCHIRTLDTSGELETIFLNRSSDSRLDNVNYESPWHYLGTDKLVMVFSSMLMERRIILYSSNLSVLTQTCHALCALLYPFHWQHVYIPLLPGEMLDVVCAPMPFIAGVLTSVLPRVHEMDIEEVLMVDLDQKIIVKSQGDEATLLPKAVQRALKTAINMCKVDAEAHKSQWLMITEAFLRMFVEVVGHFTNHISAQQDGNIVFQRDGFIQEIVSKELKEFLEWFTETQMFDVFIMNYVDKADCGTSDLFMQRLTELKEAKEELRRQKSLGAKVKNFGKALKTKLVS